MSSGQLALTRLINGLGVVPYAAYFLCNQAESISYLPGFGISIAATTLVGQALGAGEICVNSIDNDGTHQGYDLDITGKVAAAVNVPVIASGGAGTPQHIADAFQQTGASAAIISSMLYSPRMPRNYGVQEIKEYLLDVYKRQLRPRQSSVSTVQSAYW